MLKTAFVILLFFLSSTGLSHATVEKCGGVQANYQDNKISFIKNAIKLKEVKLDSEIIVAGCYSDYMIFFTEKFAYTTNNTAKLIDKRSLVSNLNFIFKIKKGILYINLTKMVKYPNKMSMPQWVMVFFFYHLIKKKMKFCSIRSTKNITI